MKKKLLKATGIVAVVFALVANVQYALAHYGLGTLTPAVQMSSSTSTDETSTDETNTDSSAAKKVCGTDDCEKTTTYGVPPYQVTVTLHGHYTHCKTATSGSCSSSSCNIACDATE